jgi:hypothetical protein
MRQLVPAMTATLMQEVSPMFTPRRQPTTLLLLADNKLVWVMCAGR